MYFPGNLGIGNFSREMESPKMIRDTEIPGEKLHAVHIIAECIQ